MKKPEVYIILEEIIENHRSFFDVDIQVLDGSAAHKKIRYNTIDKARDMIEKVFKRDYDVMSVQELIKPVSEKASGSIKKDYRNDVFSPSYVTYEIEIETFKMVLDDFLTHTKKWDIPYLVSYEESENENRLGEIYFFVDIDEVSDEVVDALESEYGNSIIMIDFLEVFLCDMFEVTKVSYDFNLSSEKLIVKIPMHEYKQK